MQTHCFAVCTMGGGNSKLNAGEAVAVPVKIRPVLLRRFEELRKGRSAARLQVEGTLSKKQLLKDAEEEDSNSHSSNETKTEDKVSTKVIQLAKEETGVQGIATEKLSRVVPLPNSECEVEEEKDSNQGNVEQDNKHNDHDDQENVDDSTESNVEQDNKHNDHDDQENVKESNKSNVEQDNKHYDHDDQEKVKDTNKSNVEQDNKHNDHDDQKKVIHVDEKAEAEVKIEKEEATLPEPDKEQDVDDDDESEQFGMFLPGSPSFRIYCIEAEKGQEEEREYRKN